MANCKKQYLFDHLKLSDSSPKKNYFPKKQGKIIPLTEEMEA